MKKVALSLAALLIFHVAAFASEKSATVKLDQSVTVGSSTIKAGEYKITWTEPGPDTNVTFTQGKKEIAIVPATVQSTKNSDVRVFTATAGSSKVLQGVELKNATLTFSSIAATAGKQTSPRASVVKDGPRLQGTPDEEASEEQRECIYRKTGQSSIPAHASSEALSSFRSLNNRSNRRLKEKKRRGVISGHDHGD